MTKLFINDETLKNTEGCDVYFVVQGASFEETKVFDNKKQAWIGKEEASCNIHQYETTTE